MENGKAVEVNYEGESDPETHGGRGGESTETTSTQAEVAVEHPTDSGGGETWRTARGDSKVANNQMIRQSGPQIDIEFEDNLPTFFISNPLLRFIFGKLFLLDCFVEQYDMEITLKWRPKDE